MGIAALAVCCAAWAADLGLAHLLLQGLDGLIAILHLLLQLHDLLLLRGNSIFHVLKLFRNRSANCSCGQISASGLKNLFVRKRWS